MPRKVAVLVGSLRKESFSRKLAKALVPLAAPALELKIVEIGDLPIVAVERHFDARDRAVAGERNTLHRLRIDLEHGTL